MPANPLVAWKPVCSSNKSLWLSFEEETRQQPYWFGLALASTREAVSTLISTAPSPKNYLAKYLEQEDDDHITRTYSNPLGQRRA